MTFSKNVHLYQYISCFFLPQLANSESLCLDAADQIQILEEKLASAHDNDTNTKGDCEDLSETVHAKDQLILKLQNEFKTCQSEANTNVSLFF